MYSMELVLCYIKIYYSDTTNISDIKNMVNSTEFFDPVGCVGDFTQQEGNRITLALRDADQNTCVSPADFSKERYLTKTPVTKYKRKLTVQILGKGLICRPFEGLMVYAVTSDHIVMCSLRSSSKHDQYVNEGCTYKCACHNGCSEVFVDIYHSNSTTLQVCEINI